MGPKPSELTGTVGPFVAAAHFMTIVFGQMCFCPRRGFGRHRKTLEKDFAAHPHQSAYELNYWRTPKRMSEDGLGLAYR